MTIEDQLRNLVRDETNGMRSQLTELVTAQREILRLLRLLAGEDAGGPPGGGTDPDPEPDPDPPAGGGGPIRPGDIVPLDGVRPVDVLPIAADWTVTLPIGKPGTKDSPWNDYPDRLLGGRAPGMFYAAQVRGRRGVVFEVRDPSKGVTTAHSNYPRSELRQMLPGERWEEAAFPCSRPTVITFEGAILVGELVTRQRCSGLQIHGGDDDIWQVIADEQGRLGVSYNDGDGWLTLRERYAGEPFRLVARNDSAGHCTFEIDGQSADESFIAKGSGWYVKAGAYLQTGGRSKYVEPATAVGRVVVFDLDVQPRGNG